MYFICVCVSWIVGIVLKTTLQLGQLRERKTKRNSQCDSNRRCALTQYNKREWRKYAKRAYERTLRHTHTLKLGELLIPRKKRWNVTFSFSKVLYRQCDCTYTDGQSKRASERKTHSHLKKIHIRNRYKIKKCALLLQQHRISMFCWCYFSPFISTLIIHFTE